MSPPPKPRFSDVPLATAISLHYAELGTGSGEPVLFLHGFTDSWFSFSRVLRRLPPWVHAFAVDQRGHGNSDRPRQGYAISDFAADALAFLEAVGLSRATVVGHSMGSLVAQHLAIDHPERVDRLVLVGSTADPRTEGARELEARIETLTEPEVPAFLRELSKHVTHRPLPEKFFEGVVAESRKVPLRVWRAASAGLMAFDRASDLSRIGAPTLIVWGAHDDIFPRAQQERLAEAIPDATLRVYPDAAHAPHWEHPKRFTRDLARFVESTRPTR